MGDACMALSAHIQGKTLINPSSYHHVRLQHMTHAASHACTACRAPLSTLPLLPRLG